MAQIFETEGYIPSTVFRKLMRVLNDGGVAITASDTVYGLLTGAFDRQSFLRLDKIKGSRELPYTLNFASSKRLENWYGRLNPFQRRVSNAVLPGPVTLIFPYKPAVPKGFRHRDHGLGVRIPSDALTPELCDRAEMPIWSTSANRSGQTAPTDFPDVDPGLLEDVDLALNSGPTIYRRASTVIDLRQFPYRIKRPGPWLDHIKRVLHLAAQPMEVLIICTGNICRSPLAGAVLGDMLGDPDRSGVHVSSAGINAAEGLPATDHMKRIAAEWGIDLNRHRGRQLTGELARSSDVILTAEPLHRDWIIELAPDVEDRIEMLGDPVGFESIPDPYGSEYEAYRQSADLIRRAAAAWRVRLQTIVAEAGWCAR